MVSEMQAKNSNEIQLVVKIHRHTHMTGAGENQIRTSADDSCSPTPACPGGPLQQ